MTGIILRYLSCLLLLVMIVMQMRYGLIKYSDIRKLVRWKRNKVCPSEFFLKRHGATDEKWNEGDRCLPINKMSAIQWRCPEVCTKTRRGNRPYCTLPGQKWKPCRIDAE